MNEESLRTQKMNQLLTEEVGKILFRNIDISRDNLITISRISTSSDLKNSTIYITIFPENKEEEVIAQINRQIYEVQKILNRTLRTKPIPRIRFEIDKLAKAEQSVFKAMEHIDETATED